MTFWNQRFWFERSGERFVFRPTVFSRGYDVSESEKDQLFRGLTRLNWRLFCEGLVVLAAAAALLMSGAIKTATPLLWFVFLCVLGVGILAVTGLARRDRLIARILGGREPDVPRLPLRGALTTPRPPISNRYALPVLRSVVVLFCLGLAAVDGLTVYLLDLASHSAQGVTGSGARGSEGTHFAATFSNPEIWVALGLFNALVAACAIFLAREVRRLSRLPELDASAGLAEPPSGRGRA